MAVMLDLLWGVVLAAYGYLAVRSGEWVYSRLRGVLGEERARYLARKFIHIVAGGVPALLTPILFTEPWIPAALAWLMGAYILASRLRGRRAGWQEEGNLYEVNFCFAWGASLLVIWLATGDAWAAVLPALIISFGDGVTGIARALLVGRRVKHWVGNLAMAIVTVPMGYAVLGPVGALVATISSMLERVELPPIDDNVIVAAASTVLILAALR